MITRHALVNTLLQLHQDLAENTRQQAEVNRRQMEILDGLENVTLQLHSMPDDQELNNTVALIADIVNKHNNAQQQNNNDPTSFDPTQLEASNELEEIAEDETPPQPVSLPVAPPPPPAAPPVIPSNNRPPARPQLQQLAPPVNNNKPPAPPVSAPPVVAAAPPAPVAPTPPTRAASLNSVMNAPLPSRPMLNFKK